MSMNLTLLIKTCTCALTLPCSAHSFNRFRKCQAARSYFVSKKRRTGSRAPHAAMAGSPCPTETVISPSVNAPPAEIPTCMVGFSVIGEGGQRHRADAIATHFSPPRLGEVVSPLVPTATRSEPLRMARNDCPESHLSTRTRHFPGEGVIGRPLSSPSRPHHNVCNNPVALPFRCSVPHLAGCRKSMEHNPRTGSGSV
jgi:hypothetical protein